MAFTPGPFSTLKDGFRWIDCHQEEKCVYVFCRQGGGEVLTALFNFSDRPRSYDLPTDRPMQVRLDTEWDIYGGIVPVCHNAGPHLDLPPLLRAPPDPRESMGHPAHPHYWTDPTKAA